MNIQEIDKWLDNEYGCSYTRLEELHDFAVEQDLKHREEKDKEIDRLNNIINELEKDIQKEIERTNNIILEDASMVEINNIRKMLNEERQCILYKLKELKEGNK